MFRKTAIVMGCRQGYTYGVGNAQGAGACLWTPDDRVRFGRSRGGRRDADDCGLWVIVLKTCGRRWLAAAVLSLPCRAEQLGTGPRRNVLSRSFAGEWGGG